MRRFAATWLDPEVRSTGASPSTKVRSRATSQVAAKRRTRVGDGWGAAERRGGIGAKPLSLPRRRSRSARGATQWGAQLPPQALDL